MIPKPLAWGIIVVLTSLEALNVIAAVFRPGYVSDPLVHFAFTTIVGFMLGVKEGNGIVARAMSAVRGLANPPSADPAAVPPPDAQQDTAP